MSSAPSRSADPFSVALQRALTSILVAVRAIESPNTVVLIDGRSGSGKTTLARMLAEAWPSDDRAQVIALDSLYPGWDGLAQGAIYAREHILVPHGRGRFSTWQQWDWDINERTQAQAVNPSLPIIMEGCGALTAASKPLVDVAVWVDGPAESRKRRAIDRDGETYASHWDQWAAQEDAHIANEAPASLADITIRMP